MLRILCIVTGGAGDGRRARRLLANLNAEIMYYDVDKSRPRYDSFCEIYDLMHQNAWDIIFQEGTGIVGGINLIWASWMRDQRYVVSSGDPIGGFFRTTKGPMHGIAFSLYERLLYQASEAFVGWTPYLTGAALELGAPRGATIEGAVDLSLFRPASASRRIQLRRHYSLAKDHLVCGVVGSLTWSEQQQYCYGLDLIEALKRVNRPDLSVLIVGDGSGRAELERRVPDHLLDRVVFTGRVPAEEVPDVLNAMDVGFITQTLDGLGSFRLTTKLPEYLATGLPVAMSPIPGYFDYVGDTAGWSLPPEHPASPSFHAKCAAFLDKLNHDEVRAKRDAARKCAELHFGYDQICDRFRTFMESVLGVSRSSSSLDRVTV